MAKPIVRIQDKLNQKDYFLIWDTFYEAPETIGMDIISLGLFIDKDWPEFSNFIELIQYIFNSSTSLLKSSTVASSLSINSSSND